MGCGTRRNGTNGFESVFRVVGMGGLLLSGLNFVAKKGRGRRLEGLGA
jgi:hypothetical protein